MVGCVAGGVVGIPATGRWQHNFRSNAPDAVAFMMGLRVHWA